MKKIIIVVFCIFLLNNLSSCSSINKDSSLKIEELDYEEIADKLIRFHVIANSDSDEDQEVKLKVRDKVINSLEEQLADAKNLNEARNILLNNIDNVNNIAEEVLEENGFSYGATTMLSNENFPDKIYGDYLFPQGNYEAYRIILGTGEGHNWWCVMFPPLCFADETKNEVDSDEISDKLQLSKDKNKDSINNEINDDGYEESEEKTLNNEKNVVFKFKIFEIIKNLFK